MPYDRNALATMTANDPEEFVNIKQIAERLDIDERSVQRLAERFKVKLKKHGCSRLENGKRKTAYRWAAILECAKIHVGLLEEGKPSRTVKRMNAKRRADETAMKTELFQWIRGDVFPASQGTRYSALWLKEHHPKKYEKAERILKSFGVDFETVLNRRRNGLPVDLPEN